MCRNTSLVELGLVLLCLLLPAVQGFFFGGGGCHCPCRRQPICPPPPACPVIQGCSTQSASSSYARPPLLFMSQQHFQPYVATYNIPGYVNSYPSRYIPPPQPVNNYQTPWIPPPPQPQPPPIDISVQPLTVSPPHSYPAPAVYLNSQYRQPILNDNNVFTTTPNYDSVPISPTPPQFVESPSTTASPIIVTRYTTLSTADSPSPTPYEPIPYHEQQRNRQYPAYGAEESPEIVYTPNNMPIHKSGYKTVGNSNPFTKHSGQYEVKPSTYTTGYDILPNYDKELKRDTSAEIKDDLDTMNRRNELLSKIKNIKQRDDQTAIVPRTRSTCNSEKLGEIMLKVMLDDVSISKRLISKAAANAFDFERYDVFCAKGEFSYSIHARKYCEVTKESVTCFAFR